MRLQPTDNEFQLQSFGPIRVLNQKKEKLQRFCKEGSHPIFILGMFRVDIKETAC